MVLFSLICSVFRFYLMVEIGVMLTAPHQDIPINSKLLAQIIVDNRIFAQTLPVESDAGKKDSWKFDVECKMYICVS